MALNDDLEFRQRMGVVPIALMLGADPEDTFALKRTYSKARSILSDLPFVERIEEAWFGGGLGEIVAVFLFRFQFENDSHYGWLVCGDIPWLFAPTIDSRSSKAILELYLDRVREWNRNGGTEPEYCFIGTYHPDLTDELERRLQFIEDQILPLMPKPTHV